MKLNFLFCLVLLASTAKSAPTLIVYGEDNRTDTFESTVPLFKTLAQSAAAMVPNENIKFVAGNAELIGRSLKETFRMCKDERFVHQPVVAICSGFLVAPDIMATAGHCINSQESCSQYKWVFNYKVSEVNQRNVTVNATDVYECKKVIKSSYTRDEDFALIRLDRPVSGVTPVKIATRFPKIGDSVVMIGHPSGLPQKITDKAVVKSVSKTEFKATLDAFQINSGSAVFNSTSGELLGILVRGMRDYKTRENENCTEVNSTIEDDVGEDVSSFTQFKKYL